MALSPASFPRESTDIREVYELCSSGHVLSNRNLGRLGNAVQTFLTPGQTVKSVEGLLDALRSSLQGFFDVVESKSRNGSPKKKKKGTEAEANAMDVDPSAKMGTYDADNLAVSFSLQAHLALVFFSNLAMHSLNESSAEKVQDATSQFQVSTVEISIEKFFKSESILSGVGKKKRRRDSLTSHEGWNVQIVAAAVSRIQYALTTSKSLNVGKRGYPSKIIEQWRALVTEEGGKGSLIAELELEIVRSSRQIATGLC